MGQTLLAKKEVNKVSKARMCEVMLDIQMIVPTGRSMGDGRGIRNLSFFGFSIVDGKCTFKESLKMENWYLEIPMCSIWTAMSVEEMFSSVRSCFSKSCDYIYVSLFSFLFHFSLFSFSLFSLRFLFSLFSFPLFSCFTKTTAGHRALDGGQRGGLEWHICFPDWTSSHRDDTQHLLFIIYHLIHIYYLLFWVAHLFPRWYSSSGDGNGDNTAYWTGFYLAKHTFITVSLLGLRILLFSFLFKVLAPVWIDLDGKKQLL